MHTKMTPLTTGQCNSFPILKRSNEIFFVSTLLIRKYSSLTKNHENVQRSPNEKRSW